MALRSRPPRIARPFQRRHRIIVPAAPVAVNRAIYKIFITPLVFLLTPFKVWHTKLFKT
ncbi:hypothetical protein DESC_100054 [Desulfosarcina cetonica]|nr:hypothetical protein DESC_100054 [Desulfosarcina cetonica]